MTPLLFSKALLILLKLLLPVAGMILLCIESKLRGRDRPLRYPGSDEDRKSRWR